MADDNPPIAQPEPASLGNQRPTDSAATAAAAHHHLQVHQDLPQSTSSSSTSATTIADPPALAATASTDAIAPPKAMFSASAKPNLSFATETHTEQAPVHEETHDETNVDVPMALIGAEPSVAEGYSIYSNIKDGKVMKCRPNPPVSFGH